MSIKKRGLGKGLNELLSATLGAPFVATQVAIVRKEQSAAIAAQTDVQAESAALGAALESMASDNTVQSLRYLAVEQLETGAFQPRQHVHQESLEQLAESIRAQGILQPIVVRPKTPGHFEIVAGERRWRAAMLAGLTEVPTIVREIPDNVAMILALIENIQREDLNPIEEAQAMRRLCENLDLTHLQVAEAVGKSRASVTNMLRLLSLNADVQILLEQGQLEMGHARALLALKGSLQSEIAATVAERCLSVRETERLVSKLQEAPGNSSVRTKTVTVDPNIRRLENDLADKLGARVNIRHGQKGKGMLVIRYNDVDELEGILAHFSL